MLNQQTFILSRLAVLYETRFRRKDPLGNRFTNRISVLLLLLLLLASLGESRRVREFFYASLHHEDSLLLVGQVEISGDALQFLDCDNMGVRVCLVSG